MRKVLVLGLLFGTLAAWNTGCTGSDDDDDDHNPPDSITISGGTTVVVGSSLQLTATAVGGSEPGDVTANSAWTTNSAGVATVGAATGLVTGVSAGTATISADHDGVIGQVTLTVTTAGAAAFDFSITFNTWPHGDADSGTGVRVMQGTTRVYCNAAVNAGATWTRTASALLQPGLAYTVEVWGDAGGGDNNNVFDTGADHTWLISIPAVAANYNETFPHATTQAAITWPDGTACP